MITCVIAGRRFQLFLDFLSLILVPRKFGAFLLCGGNPHPNDIPLRKKFLVRQHEQQVLLYLKQGLPYEQLAWTASVVVFNRPQQQFPASVAPLASADCSSLLSTLWISSILRMSDLAASISEARFCITSERLTFRGGTPRCRSSSAMSLHHLPA